jgi:outer membrane murein-binding lipoprotein Lpp
MRSSIGSAALAAAVLLAGALLAGCGEQNDSPADQDRLALQDLSAQIELAALDTDVGAFCDLMQPSLVNSAFGGRQGCLKTAESAVAPDSPLAELEIEKVVTDGEGAIVTYSQEPPGQILFAREQGTWYIALDELARAREEALKNQSGNGS